MKWRIVLRTGQIRKENRFLRSWANRTESDDLAALIMAHLLKTDRGDKAVLRGQS